jgi:hypothetical protein
MNTPEQPREPASAVRHDQNNAAAVVVAPAAAATPKNNHRPRSKFLPGRTSKSKPAQKRYGMVFFFFGVIVPVVAMLFETITHFCARHFFDPFPSPGHTILFALIPLSNFLAWLSFRKDLSSHYAFMSLISGMAMGIGCLYSLMFLPLAPLSCFFVLALGFGLLGLAPILSLPCTWMSGKTVCGLAHQRTYFDAHQVEHIGHLIILCMVVAVELPSTLTRINLSMSANPATMQQGITWLRKYGSQEVMLRACYERSGRATDILGSIYESAHPLGVDNARKIFYQVTGKPFNSVPIPASARATMQHTSAIHDLAGVNATVDDEFDLDADIAGEVVSGVARGLGVTASSVTGTIDPDAAVSELTWSFTFNNSSKIDREARAKILLPPDAVVTKATLVINGIERTATVMTRGAARAFYRQAVKEHKDPLLISMAGTDQILVQCFPVPPEMKVTIKLQMTAPLSLNNDEAELLMPSFAERNFQADAPMQLNLTSSRPFKVSQSTLTTVPHAGSFELTGTESQSDLARFTATIHCERDKNCTKSFSHDTDARSNFITEHTIEHHHQPGPKNLFIVIDGSVSMKDCFAQLIEGLRLLPKSLPAKITFIGDQTKDLASEFTDSSNKVYSQELDALSKLEPVGGQDNSSALMSRLRMAATDPGSAVLWIHAAQPIAKDRAWKRAQRIFNNQSNIPLLYDLQITSSADELVGGINAYGRLVRVPRSDSLRNDLLELYYSWRRMPPPKAELPPEFRHFETDSTNWSGHECKINIAPLWAYRQILISTQNQGGYKNGPSSVPSSVLVSGSPFETIDPAQLAMTYGIVTPISSAVVMDPIVTPQAIRTPEPTLLQKINDAYTRSLAALTSISVLDEQREMSSKSIEFKSRYAQTNEASQFAAKAPTLLEKDKQSDQQVDKSPMPTLHGATNGTTGSGDFKSWLAANKPLRQESVTHGFREPARGVNAGLIGAASDPSYTASPSAPAPAPATRGDIDLQPQGQAFDDRRSNLKKQSTSSRDQLYDSANAPTPTPAPTSQPFTWPFEKPAPEPDTWLLLSGLVAVASVMLVLERRRKAAKQ